LKKKKIDSQQPGHITKFVTNVTNIPNSLQAASSVKSIKSSILRGDSALLHTLLRQHAFRIRQQAEGAKHPAGTGAANAGAKHEVESKKQQKKEKSFILCSKDNKLVTHVISKYNQMANKPKRKRNKRRGKLIKESMRHRFYYPFLTKINTKGYLYTMSFIRYEDQINILYKLYLAKILKYKFKYLPAFAYITKKSVHALRQVSKARRLSDNTVKRVKGGRATVINSTLSMSMKKRLKKRIKKRSKIKANNKIYR